jgi:hypothetical protein
MGLLIARALQERLGLAGRLGCHASLFCSIAAEAENRRLGINVAMKLVSMFDRQPPTGLDLLVVDEAQHDAARSMAVLHQTIRHTVHPGPVGNALSGGQGRAVLSIR